MTAPDTVDSPPPPAKRVALWEDFIDIFYAPTDVFERRRTMGFVVPWLIVAALFASITFATFGTIGPILDETVNRAVSTAMQKRPDMPDEQVELSRKIGGGAARVALVVGTPFVILGLGIAIWLVGMFFKSGQTLNTALLVASYAYVPRVVGAIAIGVQGLILDVSKMHSIFALSLSPARFLNGETASQGMLGLLMRFDVLVLWSTVLIAIGYAATSKMSRAQGFLAAFIIWLVATLPAIWQVAMH